MKKFYFIFFLFLTINNLIAQSNKTNNSSDTSDEIVYTPAGPIRKSKTHFVDKEHHLNVKDGRIQIIETKTGKVSQEFNYVPTKNNNQKNKNITRNLKNKSDKLPSDSGWITDAIWYNYSNIPITYFSTNWIVPSPPSTSSNQVIFLFNGLESTDSVISYILQPVLQWGVSSAGGGNYWAITNWYVPSNWNTGGQYFYGSLMPVSPGTNLQGVIKLTSESGNNYSYNSSFTGYSSGCALQVNNVGQLNSACETLEVHRITKCTDYPPDIEVKMTGIQIKTGSIYPSMLWSAGGIGKDCGQHTIIISNSSNSGEVDIYFHTPCTGLPNPGYTLSSIYPVCLSTAFTLSIQNTIFPNGGLTYQWQTSPDSITWTNIYGDTNNTYIASYTDTTWYRCAVTCSGYTGISIPLHVTMTTDSICYCLGTYTYGGCYGGIEITNVTFGSINDTTKGYCKRPYDYNDHTNFSTTVEQGLSYPISVSSDSDKYYIYWGIWVDWNNSGSFTDNVNKYTVINNNGTNYSGTGTIVVPANAIPGKHRMRIRANFYSDPEQANACFNLVEGEQTDYSVNVILSTGISNLNNEQHLNIYPNPVTNELIIETSSNYSFDVSLTNIVGQTIYNNILNKKAVIDMSNLANGMYLIKISNENGSVVRKVIKE